MGRNLRSACLTPDKKGNVDQPSVLIISDDAELSRAVTGRWQSERTVPAFTLMSSDICLGFDPDTFQLAIAGGLRPQALSVVLEAMASGRPVIGFAAGGGLETVIDGITGKFFYEPTAESLAAAVLDFEENITGFNARIIRAHTEKFARGRFTNELKAAVTRQVEKSRIGLRMSAYDLEPS